MVFCYALGLEKRIRDRQILALIIVFFVALAIRWLVYCWSNSVNLLFADQWDFYQPYFDHESCWGMFRRLHGPHRQGLGGITTYWVATLSSWNTRWEAIHVAVIQILTVGLALGLKWRLTRKWSLWDLLIPLIFLSFSQYELPVLVANPAHSYWPNALMLLIAHCMLIHRDSVRVGMIAVLFFVLIHTGFGFLSAPLFLIYFSYEMFLKRKYSVWGFISVVLSVVVFLYGHDFQSASPCEPGAIVPISRYFSFPTTNS